jgi:hypothetical protein
MHHAYSRSGDFIKTLITAIILVTIMAVVISSVFKSPTPSVQVTECTLASDNVNTGQIVPVSISLQSNDVENSHNIRIEFTSHVLVSFLVGSRQLPTEGNVWYYDETLDSKAKLTNQINVRPLLEEGVSKITYRIDISVYNDGTQIFKKGLDLVVQRP